MEVGEVSTGGGGIAGGAGSVSDEACAGSMLRPLVLPETFDGDSNSYNATLAALTKRFDPESCHTRCQVKFHTRHINPNEGRVDDFKTLADKVYPTLKNEARDQLAINAFLQQITQPQLAFSVKQKRPKTLDDAVSSILEMESYINNQHQ